jgi:hypothetical protein
MPPVVAVYLRNGEPDDRRGAYGKLRSWDIVRPLTWVHDGTVGVRAVASEKPTAVIMLGTAVGVGFAPHPSTVRPAVLDFAIG